MSIPKTIHYCWFGGNPKSEIIERCIASWKAYCPDYEIIEWNERNFDVNCIPYVADAYAAKKWAFVSDYARLYVVHEHGGIYLDTDVLLHNRIDDLLQYDCWFAQEDLLYISTGLGFGAQKGHPTLRAMMHTYENSEFNHLTNGVMDMHALNAAMPNWIKSEYSQLVNDIYIIGMKDYGNYARHLATISWKDTEQRDQRSREINDILNPSFFGNVRIACKKAMYRFKCLVRHKKIIQYIDSKKGTGIEKVYLFLAYDFLDYGPWHYVKLICSKLRKQK